MSLMFQTGFQRAFGTWPLRGETLRRAILDAAEAGYRAFDTAQMYANEAETGAALAETGLPRDALCITTKVSIDNYAPDRFLPSVEQSVRDLRIDRADVLLLHWPPADGAIGPALDLLQEAQARGLAAHVGVSNFTVAMMQAARARLSVPLVVNQVEFHPLLDQSRLLAAAAQTGIALSAYCAVARGEVFKVPLLAGIAADHGRTVAQIVLRWTLQKGVAVTTMSTRPENIRANFDVMDFALSPAEMALIDTLGAMNHRIVGRPGVPFAPDFD